MLPPPPTSTLFPYTTLFRSAGDFQIPLLRPFYVSPPLLALAFVGPVAMWLDLRRAAQVDRKSTRLNSSHVSISYAVFCLKKKKKQKATTGRQRTTLGRVSQL